MNGVCCCGDPAALWVNGTNEQVAANTIKDRQVVCPLVCALLNAHMCVRAHTQSVVQSGCIVLTVDTVVALCVSMCRY